MGTGASLPKPFLRLLASTPLCPGICGLGCCTVPGTGIVHCLLLLREELGRGVGTSPRDAIVLGSSLHPWLEAWRARWSSCRGSDLKDGTWETHGRQGAGIWGPRGTAKADQALALRGLRPLLGWDELPALCFGVIYRAAIYIASISAAVWGRCKEARGEGSSLPRPWCPDAGCPAPLARVAAGSGSVGASLAAVALGASTLQKKLHIRSVALGCQVFFELALLVSAKK